MASNVNTGSSVRHAAASKIVITLQSLVILSLTYWLAEEYLNNMYLRLYVSDVFQANGLIIGTLVVLLMAGSISSLMLVRRRRGEKRFGAVSLEITKSSPKIKLQSDADATPKTTSLSAKPSTAGAISTTDFHPVVAALKADMAERRLSFGSMVGSGMDQPPKVSSPSTEAPKASVLDQLTPNRQTPATGPMPGQTQAPPAQRPLPLPPPQQPAGSNVLQTPQPPAPTPLKITTVITGIMPAQKKKDPNAPPDEKPASQ